MKTMHPVDTHVIPETFLFSFGYHATSMIESIIKHDGTWNDSCNDPIVNFVRLVERVYITRHAPFEAKSYVQLPDGGFDVWSLSFGGWRKLGEI